MTVSTTIRNAGPLVQGLYIVGDLTDMPTSPKPVVILHAVDTTSGVDQTSAAATPGDDGFWFQVLPWRSQFGPGDSGYVDANVYDVLGGTLIATHRLTSTFQLSSIAITSPLADTVLLTGTEVTGTSSGNAVSTVNLTLYNVSLGVGTGGDPFGATVDGSGNWTATLYFPTEWIGYELRLTAKLYDSADLAYMMAMAETTFIAAGPAHLNWHGLPQSPLAAHDLGDDSLSLVVSEVGGTPTLGPTLVLDRADSIPMRTYDLGDGTYALGVARQRMGEFVTARLLEPVVVDGQPVIVDGIPVLAWDGEYENVTDRYGNPVTVYA